MSEFGSNVGGNLVSFVIVGVFGMIWFLLKNKCKHCKSNVNSPCCHIEMDDIETQRSEGEPEEHSLEVREIGVQTLEPSESKEETAVILTLN